MPPPVAHFQVRKFFEQIARSLSFDSPHDFAGGTDWGSTHQNRDMVFTVYASDNPYLKRFTGLSYQASDSHRYLTTQHFATILGYPHKMVLNLVNCMTAVAIIHLHLLGSIIAAKADGLDLMMDN